MQTFDQVYSENHKTILNFICMKIKDFSMAEELTNDVFMKLHKHFDKFDEEKASMKTWVMNIAKNTVIDHYRRVKLDVISLDNSNTNSEGVKITIVDKFTNSMNPHKEMVTTEMLDKIQGEISSLDEKYRDVADLFFNEELSYEEIGMRLKLPLGTVKGQISRARKKLVDRLQTIR